MGSKKTECSLIAPRTITMLRHRRCQQGLISAEFPPNLPVNDFWIVSDEKGYIITRDTPDSGNHVEVYSLFVLFDILLHCSRYLGLFTTQLLRIWNRVPNLCVTTFHLLGLCHQGGSKHLAPHDSGRSGHQGFLSLRFSKDFRRYVNPFGNHTPSWTN